jgi:hypothetical protein
MKISKVWKYGLIGLGVVILGWVLQVMFLQEDKPTTVTDSSHCKVCGKELPPVFQNTEECPFCQRGKPGSKGKSAPLAPLMKMPIVLIGLIGLFVLLCCTHGVLFLRLRKRATRKELADCRFNCPKCKRRLRYRASHGGRAGRCPTCGRAILFPAVA